MLSTFLKNEKPFWTQKTFLNIKKLFKEQKTFLKNKKPFWTQKTFLNIENFLKNKKNFLKNKKAFWRTKKLFDEQFFIWRTKNLASTWVTFETVSYYYISVNTYFEKTFLKNEIFLLNTKTVFEHRKLFKNQKKNFLKNIFFLILRTKNFVEKLKTLRRLGSPLKLSTTITYLSTLLSTKPFLKKNNFEKFEKLSWRPNNLFEQKKIFRNENFFEERKTVLKNGRTKNIFWKTINIFKQKTFLRTKKPFSGKKKPF